MASTTILTDDFDRNISEDVETVSYAYQGKAYTIDLGAENRKLFSETMAEYTAVSRPDNTASPTRRGRGAARSSTSGNSDAAVIREWAEANGFTGPDGGPLPKRGRISAEIREAYEKANPAA